MFTLKDLIMLLELEKYLIFRITSYFRKILLKCYEIMLPEKNYRIKDFK